MKYVFTCVCSLVLFLTRMPCDGTIFRLVDNPYERPNIGRVQIKYNGSWTNICSLRPNKTLAWGNGHLDDLCQQLGYPGGLLTSNTSIGNNDPAATASPEKFLCFEGLCFPKEADGTPCPVNLYVRAVCAAPGYVGCFQDSTTRSLPDHAENENARKHFINASMTIQTCIRQCRESNLRYAGLQARINCYCDNDFNMLDPRDNLECATSCPGDKLDACGKDFKMSIYDVTRGRCNASRFPDNTSVNLNNSYFEFGKVVTLSCNSDLVLNGSSSIQCIIGQSSNEVTWNSTTLNCEELKQSVTGESTTENNSFLTGKMLPGSEPKGTTTSSTTLPVSGLLTVLSIENGNLFTSTIGIGVGGAVCGILAFVLIVVAICFVSKRKTQKNLKNHHEYVCVTPELDRGPRPSVDHHYADIGNDFIQLSTVTETERNDGDDNDSGAKPAPLGDSYTYVDINEEKPRGRKVSEHLYSYAEFKDCVKTESMKSNNPASSTNSAEEGEGWAENTLYNESSPEKDLSEDDHVETGTKIENEGWEDNTMYATSDE